MTFFVKTRFSWSSRAQWRHQQVGELTSPGGPCLWLQGVYYIGTELLPSRYFRCLALCDWCWTGQALHLQRVSAVVSICSLVVLGSAGMSAAANSLPVSAQAYIHTYVHTCARAMVQKEVESAMVDVISQVEGKIEKVRASCELAIYSFVVSWSTFCSGDEDLHVWLSTCSLACLTAFMHAGIYAKCARILLYVFLCVYLYINMLVYVFLCVHIETCVCVHVYVCTWGRTIHKRRSNNT